MEEKGAKTGVVVIVSILVISLIAIIGIVFYVVANASDENPDIVLCCIGDTPTLEVLAAKQIIKENTDIKVRVVNVVDLLKLESINDEEFNNIFTEDKDIIVVFHGYPSVIRDLTYNRKRNISIYGYNEEGAITTPFDMRVLNNIDRYHIVLNVLNKLNINNSNLINKCNELLSKHHDYIRTYGVDIPEVLDFKWKDTN